VQSLINLAYEGNVLAIPYEQYNVMRGSYYHIASNYSQTDIAEKLLS
jgi:hypothetical protein